ncbi:MULTISPECIES: hypothetical protein [unclassified Streptomyces]|uniref:hypothetical protein n=1 Tax=unclassified Streptomyces TaxID=2593676 RepID=UPI001AFC8DE9|nr:MULTISPECIES: hypothetical protein [unclassified Streptomyces]CAD5953047.1 conserved protein of unknown function [Streptomyces sp. KY75]CAD5983063.1 conserved protein of unknown function [Streptomyces sp. KY70]
MALPAWNDPDLKGGTMIRGALWLVQEIGEGNTFTKEQIRDAFPGIAQADRRFRDLRAFKWVILTNTEDATLTAEDQRFVKAGVPVWDPAARRAAAPRKAITAKQTQAVLARDDYMCTVCGIGGAEPYMDDSNQTGVLSVTRRLTVLPDGREETLLVTECKRCRAGADGQGARADDVVAEIKSLDPSDQRRLARWLERGRRGTTPLERAWNAYRRLPRDAQEEVRKTLHI